jgi:hypothetical protein
VAALRRYQEEQLQKRLMQRSVSAFQSQLAHKDAVNTAVSKFLKFKQGNQHTNQYYSPSGGDNKPGHEFVTGVPPLEEKDKVVRYIYI